MLKIEAVLENELYKILRTNRSPNNNKNNVKKNNYTVNLSDKWRTL